jgi:hypothetical protein
MDPEKVEQSTKKWVAKEIEHRIQMEFNRQFPDVKVPSSKKNFQKLHDKLQKGIQHARDTLLPDLADQIERELGDLFFCRKSQKELEAADKKLKESRSELNIAIQNILDSALQQAQIGAGNVNALIQGHYMHIIEKLFRDIRLFSGTNVFLFTVILLTVLLKREQEKALILPAGLLTLSTLICSGLYIFGQDWIGTLLFNSYLGWAYVPWVFLLTGFLLDVVFNKGKYSIRIYSILTEMLGGMFSGC